MSCSQARTEIALWVGNDLEEGGELRIERHLAGCPMCREYAHEMKASLQVLQAPRPVPDVGGSIWPRLAARIAGLESSPRLERFNGWLPAVTVVAASIAIIVLLETRQPAHVQVAAPTFPVITYPDGEGTRLNSLQWNPGADRPENAAVWPEDWRRFPIGKSKQPRRQPGLVFP